MSVVASSKCCALAQQRHVAMEIISVYLKRTCYVFLPRCGQRASYIWFAVGPGRSTWSPRG